MKYYGGSTLDEDKEQVALRKLGEIMGEAAKEILSLLAEGNLRFRVRDILQFYLNRVAVFKGKVVGTNKITIPKDEMNILGLDVGDHVAVLLVKIEESKNNGNIL